MQIHANLDILLSDSEGDDSDTYKIYKEQEILIGIVIIIRVNWRSSPFQHILDRGNSLHNVDKNESMSGLA